MNNDSVATEILELNQRLLEAIANGDWSVYDSLCSPDLTCFEPETRGHLVEGMPFHKFYFDLEGSTGPRNVTMATPHVRLMGDDAAVVAYTRLMQRLNANGSPVTVRVEETRVWQRLERSWMLVHIHRSAPA
jgi:calcium/calmodulin-dependent protein kinase (CaM kinase) II